MTTRYLYDGDDLAAEVDASGNRIRSYTYFPGVDSPHSMRTWENGANGAVYYYALDLPGNNVAGMFDVTGAVTHRYSYAPFGEPVSATGTVTNPLRFAAREIDPTTGLYYVRARWYDATLGRFLSEDPIGLAGGINNYSYALNDPVNLSDPSSLGPCTLTWGGWNEGFTYACPWGGSSNIPDYYDPNMRNMDGLDDLPHHLRYGTPELVAYTYPCGGGFNRTQCGHNEEAMDALEQHPLEICRHLGMNARARTARGNYRYNHQLPVFGRMGPGQDWVELGGPAYWPLVAGSHQYQTQETIAHEEAHHLFGPGHSDDSRSLAPSAFGAPDQIGALCKAGSLYDR